jgi:hypothetical protein
MQAKISPPAAWTRAARASGPPAARTRHGGQLQPRPSAARCGRPPRTAAAPRAAPAVYRGKEFGARPLLCGIAWKSLQLADGWASIGDRGTSVLMHLAPRRRLCAWPQRRRSPARRRSLWRAAPPAAAAGLPRRSAGCRRARPAPRLTPPPAAPPTTPVPRPAVAPKRHVNLTAKS